MILRRVAPCCTLLAFDLKRFATKTTQIPKLICFQRQDKRWLYRRMITWQFLIRWEGAWAFGRLGLTGSCANIADEKTQFSDWTRILRQSCEREMERRWEGKLRTLGSAAAMLAKVNLALVKDGLGEPWWTLVNLVKDGEMVRVNIIWRRWDRLPC